MPVTRINEFEAKEGEEAALKELLSGVVSQIRAAAGCVSCRLLQAQDAPARLVVLEVWESVDAHQAAVQSIPPESMQTAMSLLAGPPKGTYYVE